MERIIITLFAICFATSVFAHSKTNTIVPEDGAILSEVPEKVLFIFSNKTKLTRVEMVYAKDNPITLDLKNSKGFEMSTSVPIQMMGTGIYNFQWRGLGADGHLVKGVFMFEVK